MGVWRLRDRRGVARRFLPLHRDWRGNGGVYLGLGPYPYSPYPTYRPDYAPPAYYAPPAATEGCYAGAYVCPLEGPAAVGMPCSCPTSRGQAWGRAR